MAAWEFKAPPNLAVITTRQVIRDGGWIGFVNHDDDDGGWQFHCHDRRELSEADAMIVSLHSVVEGDPTVSQLADLPLGWCAWRETPASPWRRGRV
jgi:hypothetical protein